MIQKVLRCTLGIFSGNIYFDIANKPDRRVWLVCCSTEWGLGGKVRSSMVVNRDSVISHRSKKVKNRKKVGLIEYFHSCYTKASFNAQKN